jgi:hypothetical protein
VLADVMRDRRASKIITALLPNTSHLAPGVTFSAVPSSILAPKSDGRSGMTLIKRFSR